MKWGVGVTTAMALSALVAAIYYKPPQNSADVAAWVQAIGSVVAIVISVGVVGWQGRQDRLQIQSRAKEAERRNLIAAHQLVEVLIALSDTIASGGLFKTIDYHAMVNHLNAVLESLARLDSTQMPTRGATVTVLTALAQGRQLSTVASSVPQTLAREGARAQLMQTATLSAQLLRTHSKTLRTILESHEATGFSK